MSNVPTNLIPTRVTGLPEYLGSSTLGYIPYIIDGRSFKVQFANIAAVGAVPSTREINTGSGLGGGGDLSANRTLYILPGGVDDSRLSVTGVTAGTYGTADSIPVFTVNAQGRVTDVTLAPIVLANYVPTSRTITAGAGLTGGGDLSANRSFAVNFSSTTPEPLGPGSSGVSTVAARGDHVHPAVDLSDTTETQGVLPLSRGGTGNSLSPVAGAIVYSSNDKLYLTTAGSVGQVLRSGGPGGVPFWTDVGAGTVTSVAVATANGFAGTVVSPTLSPVITLSTTVTGLLKGDGTGMSAATAGVDYVAPGAYTASGLTMATARLLGRTTASVGAAQEITVGTGLTLASGSLVNAAPDQVVSLTGGTAISVTGTYPSFTVTNTAPDQIVSLTGAGTTTVTGTYPNFTITSNDSTAGTVTSVNASGGTTGMSFTGGPITSAGTLTLNGTLAVANGGTGATDAVAALTNLGAYPASNPAGYTSNVGTVTSVSGTGTVSGLSLSGTVTSAGSLTLGGTLAVLPSDFASQTANTVLAAPNGSAGVPTFRAIVAADIPTLNQNTTGTASNVTGIVAVANGGTGASVASTARTNLGAAASGANTDITSIALTTGTISATPTNGTDIVNKTYADSIASGINFHQSVRLATTAALPANTYNNGASGVGATLTANANGALTVDGVAAVAGNRILVKNEAAGANNGVYTVTQVGSAGTPYILTRATDFDSSGSGVDQIDAGDFFLVTAGSTQANTSWVQQTPLPITVGTTALVFTQFAAPVLYTAGTGLTLAGTTFSITDTGVSASTYGSASSVPVLAINAQGQVTSASSSSIAIAASQITSGALAIANGGTGATSAATALTNLGAYPASNPSGFTSNTGTVTSVNLTAGTGISVSGGPVTASGSITVVNTAPDQVVSLTGSGATTVTGTYPNFTISSPTSGAGTVTSIDVSGGTTGLTTSGGPVTSSGTITLAGTLGVANGGTGATTLSSGYVLKGNGTSAVSASVVYDNGTNVGIGTTSPGSKLDVRGVITGGDGTIQTVISYLAAAGVTGTLSNHPYVLYANNAERMRIDTSGNVGIGTSSPGARLHVYNASGSSSLFLQNGASGRTWKMDSFSDGNLYLGVPFVVDAMTFTPAGNVGIGESSPGSYRLNVKTSAAQGIQLNGTGTGGSWMLWSNNGTANGYVSSAYHAFSGGSASDFGIRAENNLCFGVGSAEAIRINSSGNVTANVDFRAPIFYDSNNTAYYGDFAGTSSLNSLIVGTNGSTLAYNAAATGNLYFGSAGGDANLYYHITTNMENVGGNYSKLDFKWYTGQRFYTHYAYGGVRFKEITTGNTLFSVGESDLNVRVANAIYSPIYYDGNNSGYYGDFASTSFLNTLSARETIGSGAATPFVYSAPSVFYYWTKIANVSGGDASATILITSKSDVNYVNFASALLTISAWNGTNSSAKLETISGCDTGMNVRIDNNNDVWLQVESVWSSNLSWRVINKVGNPTVYYTSLTQQTTTPANSTNITYGQTMRGTQGAMSSASVTNVSNTIVGGLSARSEIRAPLYYDSDNTAYYIDAAGTSVLRGLTLTDGSPTMTFSSTTSGRSSAFGMTDAYNMYLNAPSGGVLFLSSFQAPIMYDRDNSGYYVDPAGTSNLVGLTVANTITGNISGNATGLNSSNYIVSSGSSGNLNTDFQNTIANTFRYQGDQANLTNSPGGTWWIYQNMRHSNASNYWGTQIAWGWEDNANRLAQRNVSGNSFSAWVEYLNTSGRTFAGDLIMGTSLRAPIFYDTTDTAYYWNFASGAQSNIYTFITGLAYYQCQFGSGVYSGSVSNPPLQVYSSDGGTAMLSFHRAGAYAINMGLDPDNVLRIGGWSASANRFQMDGSGNLTMAGNVTAYSDARLKDNVVTVANALDLVGKMRGVTYTRKDTGEAGVGVIAQEMLEVLPQVVQQGIGDDDTLSVAYGNLVGVLIEAIKELTARVAELEGK